ncbi:hypothetical protein [Salicola sp. Rm-C-2C1-2]|uniref:hypothetical protein n=1 Tax=Salicola sp. Rm-C-2C1-2 TaxID=3141321 RepID=UPI0032E3E171
MSTPAIADRYVTRDFRNAPLISLADLMGLKRYKDEILGAPEVYSPILSGIAVHRHLPEPQQRQVNRAVVKGIPGSHLQTQLMNRICAQRVQPYWYMWSLSDKELKAFYSFNSNAAAVTNEFNPIPIPDLTVTTVAGGLYFMAKGRLREAALEKLSSLKTSELVTAVGRRFGLGEGAVTALGKTALPALIVISGINIMAKNQSEQAKKELAARGLLAYEDL